MPILPNRKKKTFLHTPYQEDDIYGYQPSDETKSYQADEQDYRLGNITGAQLNAAHDAQISTMSFRRKIREDAKARNDEDKRRH